MQMDNHIHSRYRGGSVVIAAIIKDKHNHTPNVVKDQKPGERLQELKETLCCKVCGYSKKTHDRFTTAALDFLSS